MCWFKVHVCRSSIKMFYIHAVLQRSSISWMSCSLIFFTQGLHEGVFSTHPCPWSVVGPSLNISETVHLFFLIFCMKLVDHKGTEVTEPDFWKKSWGVTNGGKPHFWGIFDVFCPYLKNSSNNFDKILRLYSPHWYLTPCENRMS